VKRGTGQNQKQAMTVNVGGFINHDIDVYSRVVYMMLWP
jgi:hypothetical protein